MMRPQDTPTRETKSLDGLWDFVLDAAGDGRRDQWWRAPLVGSRSMPVPASYNDIVPSADFRDHVGDAWYQRRVQVPAGWVGQRIVLRFDAATHRATVYVDDVEVVSHEGGYTPFEADVTALVTPGSAARVTVVVNNELTFRSIPPGEVLDDGGRRRQRYHHDFFNYAGLHRTVRLCSTPRVHVADLVVTTGLDDGTGTVGYDVEVGGGVAEVSVALVDAEGREVATGSGASGTLVVPDVHPWRPGEGYLHDLVVTLHVDGVVIDTCTQPVGVRTVEVRGSSFLINGEPFYFRGFGKHEDAAVRGKGHDDALMVHDFELMAWIGANSFRTSHYPYAEEVLDYADRHGIVVIDETAAVGLNLPLSGGQIGADTRATYSSETIDDTTREVHAQAIRELVARDRNHPSVVVWCIANEPETTSEESRAYFAPLLDLTRELDPTRPVGVVNMFLAPAGRCRVSDLCDITMINRYYGWYVDAGDLAAAEVRLEAELRAWAAQGRPVVLTEYGGDALPGLHAIADVPWTEEYQVALLDMTHRVLDRVDGVVGEHVWNFADFATSSGVSRVDGNRKGVFTRERRPKAVAHALRRRWRPTA
ncbi:beta-glucuronidase [Nocardioides sp. URHA0020]|uniref:beta-glucuronidase n=1 Tax=Nocardioides sp. URHA0020 TaxID=1380392 RepID=UPI00048F15F1|nr:beta-glucuronidase [Nocardioides sp. URHA0020]